MSSQCESARQRAPQKRMASSRAPGLRLDAIDLGAEGDELGLDLLVAAVHVLDARDDGGPARGQRGEDEGGPGAKVGDADLGAVERRGARDPCPALVEDLDR